MTTLHPIEPRRWWTVAREGAVVGARMTQFYATAFIVYAAVRVGEAIARGPEPDAGAIATLGATVVSILVVSTTVTVALTIVSAVVGGVTALFSQWLLVRIVSGRGRVRPIAVSVAVAIASLLVGQLALLPSFGVWPMSIPFATYLFWFGLPSVIYLVAVTWMRHPLWRYSGRFHHIPHTP
jgi:hypothetical protein